MAIGFVRKVRSRTWVFAAAAMMGWGWVLHGGCGSPHADLETVGASTDDGRSTTGVGGAGNDEGAADPQSGSREAPRARVHYDLAAHVERAEIFEGAVRVIDFGGLAGAKYTLGGWQTSMGHEVELDGATAAVADGTRGRFQLPWDGDGDAEIVVRVRMLGRGPLFAYVDDEVIGEAPLGREDGFAIARFVAHGLARGEHTLILRSAGTGAVPTMARAGFAIDWMRIGPPSRPRDVPAPAIAATVASHAALGLDAEVTAQFALEVPAAARLRAVVRGRGDLVVRAQVDGAAPHELARLAGDVAAGNADGRRALDVDLGAFAGQLVRLDLVARGSRVELVRPVVATFDAGAARARPPRPKNVLVYLIDTLRADKLAPYNAETRVQTPGLLQFVRGAATMGSVHAQENWTKPSVATLLSSLMPWQHTAVDDASRVPQSVALLPEMLGARGFYTGSFIANGYVSNAFGFDQGWDTYRNYIREERRTEAEYVAHDVLAWLDARPMDKPFFLYVHTIDPHVPYRPPDETLALYEPAPYRGALHFRDTATLLGEVKTGRVQMNGADRAHLEALYDGEITYHDVHFAAILDGLARREIDDETLVIVTADHGEEFFDHGSVGHGHSVFEELLHVPLFVRWPGVTDTGGVASAPSAPSAPNAPGLDVPMGLVDVVPTVLDVLEQPIPDDLAGHSIVPALLGEDQTAPTFAISGFMDNWRTIVIGRTKLIHRTNGRAALYDLRDDPGEQHDVAAERPIALRYTRGLLGIAIAETRASNAITPRRASRRAHRPESTTIDPELEAQLRALGYLQ